MIQLYVHDRTNVYDRPEKELKAFRKVYLEAGEEKTVTLTLRKEDFAGYYLPRHEWIVQPGTFDLLIGTSAEEIRCRKEVRVRIADPFGISEKSGIGAISGDREAVAKINEIMEDDIEILCVVALNYAPDKSFEELWSGVNVQAAMKQKGWDDSEIERRYEKIREALKELRDQKI